MNIVEHACSTIKKRRISPSSRRRKETHLPVFRCQLSTLPARPARRNDQACWRSFCLRSCPYCSTTLQTKKYPPTLQTARYNRGKVIGGRNQRMAVPTDAARGALYDTSLSTKRSKLLAATPEGISWVVQIYLTTQQRALASPFPVPLAEVCQLQPQCTEVLLYTSTNHKTYSSVGIHMQSMNVLKYLIDTGDDPNLMNWTLSSRLGHHVKALKVPKT